MANEPRKPTIEVPAGACDTHMHVYYAGHPAAPTAVAPPPDGPPEAYRAVQRRLGLERVVVVQPSAYGFDNEPTLRAMRDLAPGTYGVVAWHEGSKTATDATRQMIPAGASGTPVTFTLDVAERRPRPAARRNYE